MRICSLELIDFRNYSHAELELNGELTAIVGANGHGKTSLLEAIGLVAGLGSIRGVSHSGLVRQDSDSAVVRCDARSDNGRGLLIESQIFTSGRSRFQVNRQHVNRNRDLLGMLTVTVFSPDDLMLVKGGPAGRRRWVDTALAASFPGFGERSTDLDRILRHRNALLRQISGRPDPDSVRTLDVWDAKLAEVGDEIRRSRMEFLRSLESHLSSSYEHVAGRADAATARYESSWGDEPLADALAQARQSDLRRAVSTVGPHRDDVELEIGGLSARTQASQGEQRSLALALRLAVDAEIRCHRHVTPILLLDDVFSELDAARSAALLEILPTGQRILTSTATVLPARARPDQVVRVYDGTLRLDEVE